jgi:hypothetical protein
VKPGKNVPGCKVSNVEESTAAFSPMIVANAIPGWFLPLSPSGEEGNQKD